MITSSDRRARCTREDRVERRQDKARVRGVSGVQEILRGIVENPAVVKARDEEVSVAIPQKKGRSCGFRTLGR